MASLDIPRQRLRSEHLTGPRMARPEDVVGWLGAVQAQDFAGAKWAIGQRTRGCTDADVEQAFARGKILRTHVLRPTWHFVLPADLRWMLELTAPRVKAASAYYAKQNGLDDRTFLRSNAAIARALEGGKHLTRTDLARVLEDARIKASGPRLGHLMMRAELDAVICSGPRRGKQFTYALVDERAPPARKLPRDEALAALSERYFNSHGPALAQDFARWSGLTVADAKRGIEAVGRRLISETAEGKTYWLAPSRTPAPIKKPTVHLLPNYDEYLVSYEDYRPVFSGAVGKALYPGDNFLSVNVIVSNGIVVGGWRRIFEKKAATVETRLLVRLGTPERNALRAAADAYGRFLGLPVRLRPVLVASTAS